MILGYRVVTSPERMGRGFAAYVMVGLSSHTKAAQERFERAMTVAPEVVECHNIAGAFEYLLRVESADLSEYKHFHTEVLGTQSHVNAITSCIVMAPQGRTRHMTQTGRRAQSRIQRCCRCSLHSRPRAGRTPPSGGDEPSPGHVGPDRPRPA
ncbi:proline dehydrogenase transcriptional activator [Rhodovulum sulfidophilum]|uniref:Proline dehydrogenase transcriptional activator n=1 Tax=Rhodovulum sulfidophilum TaxID=35806 RepID=A0A0D6B790_RHOSU|nr:proline dehydrogenase transcriptional activator [Rhodovulum sulfidophilum]